MRHFTYVREITLQDKNIKPVYFPVNDLHDDRDYKRTKQWCKEFNNMNKIYKIYYYELVPNSCIIKMFGSDNWTERRSK
jgi:hypothetical protein